MKNVETRIFRCDSKSKSTDNYSAHRLGGSKFWTKSHAQECGHDGSSATSWETTQIMQIWLRIERLRTATSATIENVTNDGWQRKDGLSLVPMILFRITDKQLDWITSCRSPKYKSIIKYEVFSDTLLCVFRYWEVISENTFVKTQPKLIPIEWTITEQPWWMFYWRSSKSLILRRLDATIFCFQNEGWYGFPLIVTKLLYFERDLVDFVIL